MAEFKNLYLALGAVQRAIVQPKKDAKNPMFKSSAYVTLDAVVSTINNAIRDAGAEFFWTNQIRDGLMYTIINDGVTEIELAGTPVATDLGNRGTNSAQSMGSAITYARRYSLSMAFGIASDTDDDGNGFNQSNNNNNSQRQSNQQNNVRKTELKPVKNVRTKRDDFNDVINELSKSQNRQVKDLTEEIMEFGKTLPEMNDAKSSDEKWDILISIAKQTLNSEAEERD